MSLFDDLFSSTVVIDDQLSRELFNILPEDGIILAIMDANDNVWISDPDRFSGYFDDYDYLKKLAARVDDGADFVLGQIEDCGIMVSELTAGNVHCGHTVLLMPNQTPENTLANIDVLEFLAQQTCLIADLVQRNNGLHCEELQNKSLQPVNV